MAAPSTRLNSLGEGETEDMISARTTEVVRRHERA
jgi:hypothetical protein